MTYYNENDPKAAAWLRELIRDGLIPAGDVDGRSICDVRPHELTGYIQQHFFAGIGGWAYALRLAGWPDDRPVRTGSCPCQPFSGAGKGLAEKDPRHLWPVFRDLITFGEATVTFGEQVAGKKGLAWLAGVRADLEGRGYAVGCADLCAAGTGAEAEGWIVRGDSACWERIIVAPPHLRQRIFWMAHTPRIGRQRTDTGEEPGGRRESARSGGARCVADSDGERFKKWEERNSGAPQSQQQAPCGHNPCRCGGDGGLAHADGERRGQAGCDAPRRGASHPERQGNRPGDGGAAGVGPVANASREGLSERIRDGRLQRNSLGSLTGKTAECRSDLGFWGDTRVIQFRNGKARRIKSTLEPLASGISGRVGLIRGAGNAIVPQVAAEFIQACEETVSSI